jgi:hypothetical protein
MRCTMLGLICVSSLACTGDPVVDEADSGVGQFAQDTGSGDTGSGDTGSGDTGSGDTDESPVGSWGELSGDCGVLDAEEWDSTEPVIFRNIVDLGEQEFSEDLLSEGGLQIYEAGNLGGSSLHSEILSYEVLARCEGAQLQKTEGEIVYQDEAGKKTDLLVEIDAHRVGVSVTRAYHYPPDEAYTVEEGLSLLEDKLEDVLLSADNVDLSDAWTRSMLHVIAYDSIAADAIETAHEQLSPDVRDSTLIIVTVTDGEDDIVY